MKPKDVNFEQVLEAKIKDMHKRFKRQIEDLGPNSTLNAEELLSHYGKSADDLLRDIKNFLSGRAVISGEDGEWEIILVKGQYPSPRDRNRRDFVNGGLVQWLNKTGEFYLKTRGFYRDDMINFSIRHLQGVMRSSSKEQVDNQVKWFDAIIDAYVDVEFIAEEKDLMIIKESGVYKIKTTSNDVKSKFHYFYSEIRSLKPQHQDPLLLDLCDACRSAHVNEHSQSFERMAQKITNIRTRKQSMDFYLGSLMLFFSILIFSKFMHEILKVEFLIWGSVGGFISVLVRFKDFKFEPSDNRTISFLRGANRIVVASFFGLLVVIGSESKLFLANFASNSAALVILSFIGGFSERFVPDLLENASKEQLK